MTDLVIINPAASHGIYGDLGSSLIAVEPPMWCRVIAGYARKHGFSVEIIDMEAERISLEDVASRIKAADSSLVCLTVFGHQPSASTQQMAGARVVAQFLDNQVPGFDIPTLMVGGHVAALPERTLEEEPVSFTCNGEGPQTVLALLADWPLKSVPGLVWRDGDKIVNNFSAALTDIDLLAEDGAWDLLPMHLYRAHNWQCFDDLSQRQPYASIFTSLGCPYRCSFCCINSPFASASPKVNRYRMRSPAKVVQEIQHLYFTYGVRTYKIIDELFILSERHYTAICEGIIAAGLGDKINIWAYARVDTVKEGKLDLLRKAGIKWLALGIESGSAHVRDGADKALKNDDIISVVRAIEGADIDVIGNYIFGLPDDDVSTMQQTLDLALECNTAFANFYSAMAYPGSALYKEAVEKGWTLPATNEGYSQHNALCRPLDTQKIHAREVLAFRDQAFLTYFTNPAYLDMVEKKFGAETLAHVKEMTKYRLTRKLLTGEIE